MKFDSLSQYSEPPYFLIGLDLTNELVNHAILFRIKEIFINIDDCDHFVRSQTTAKKIVVIIAGQLLPGEVTQFENDSRIEAMYQLSQANDPSEELKCVYTKTTNKPYWEVFAKLMAKFWFLLGLGLVMLLAALFPHVAASGGPLHAEYTLKWGCVIVIFFLSGLSLPTRKLTNEFLHFRLHIFTQTFNLVFIPLVVFGVCLLLAKTSFNKVFVAGIITMACTTTTISSNVIMTKNAGGNESAALVNAVLGNVLGILVSPALIWLFMSNADLNVLHQPYHLQDYLNVLFNLGITVLIPLIIGQINHLLWTEQIEWAKGKFYFTELNSISLLLLLWSVLCDLFASQLFKTVNSIDYFIVIVIDASFYIIFSLLALYFARLPDLFICCTQNSANDQQPLLSNPSEHQQKTCIERWRFSREDTIAIMFCGATKTVAKGLPLINAVNSANNQKLIGLLALPLIFYHVSQLIIGSIEVVLLQYWLKSTYEKNTEELVTTQEKKP